MTFWFGLARILLVVALIYGSMPQTGMASSQTMALHASMVSMSRPGMDDAMTKAAAGYCMQHCLAVLAILSVIELPLRDAALAGHLRPAPGRAVLSMEPAPTGPPPKRAIA